MSNDYSSLSLLLSCCLCLLCTVVLAVGGVVIYLTTRKRGPQATTPTPAYMPEAPVTGTTVVIGDPTVVETAPDAFIPRSSSAPSKPVEAYAAETMINTGPLAEPISEPAIEEAPLAAPEITAIPVPDANTQRSQADLFELYNLGFTKEEIESYPEEEIQAVLDGRISLDQLRQRHQGS